MYSASLSFPTNELFGKKPDGDHEKLQVKPIITEPEKKIGAEDDREGSKSQYIFLFSPETTLATCRICKRRQPARVAVLNGHRRGASTIPNMRRQTVGLMLERSVVGVDSFPVTPFACRRFRLRCRAPCHRSNTAIAPKKDWDSIGVACTRGMKDTANKRMVRHSGSASGVL
ncbi:MAG: hypothetical protein Ct9H300mP25_08500 [Acidobacteriota bacterium]|nr:MAG: hypothetical protein Ct9H300mP25_08500 [Acidobacteriota bacterium]